MFYLFPVGEPEAESSDYFPLLVSMDLDLPPDPLDSNSPSLLLDEYEDEGAPYGRYSDSRRGRFPDDFEYREKESPLVRYWREGTPLIGFAFSSVKSLNFRRNRLGLGYERSRFDFGRGGGLVMKPA